jgi:hypothetical protein
MTKSNDVNLPGKPDATVLPNLKLAGYLSIASAILTIPMFAMTFFLASQPDSASKLLAMVLTGAGMILFIFIFLSLKGLLNVRYGFHDTDIYINMLIWLNAVSLALTFLQLFPASEKLAEVAPLVLSVLSGIVLIIFAVKLLRLPDTLHGMLKPFAYATLATGVCFATIVLFAIGLLASILSDIFLGVIFLHAVEFRQEA